MRGAGTNVPGMPARFGRYHVRAKIGEGGMATVYLGHGRDDEGNERVVALKVIKDRLALNREFVNMFSDECKIVSRLNHPNIVRVYELGSEGARLFIAMELLFGQSLWQIWNACRGRGVRLRYDVAAWIGARVAEGLNHAHDLRLPDGASAKLVHRDVNASNIFVTYDGEVKIIDFGLAKAIGRVSKTAAGIVKGKLAYMSPEQTVGKSLDRRSDLFALGTTLWEVTTDQRLFKGADDVDTLKRVYAAEVPNPCELVEEYPPALWSILSRALAREAEDRYSTGLEMAGDLDAFARAIGKGVGKAVVGEVMQNLFRGERERQQKWMVEAKKPGPASRFARDMAAPTGGKQEIADGTLFSSPAVTLRDPTMAARQAATARGLPNEGEAAEPQWSPSGGEDGTVTKPNGTDLRPNADGLAASSRSGGGAIVTMAVLLAVAVAVGLFWMMRK